MLVRILTSESEKEQQDEHKERGANPSPAGLSPSWPLCTWRRL